MPITTPGAVWSRVAKLFRRISNLGWQRYCPICGGHARVFLPYGLARRPDVGCPTCGSAERHRFAWLFIQRYTGLLESRHTVLHIAPEPSMEERLRRVPGVRYVSLDLFAPAVSVKSDLTCLPFAPKSFDAVLCCNVLAHIPDDVKALNEIFRVLRPGGWLLLTTHMEGDVTRKMETTEASGFGWGALGNCVVRVYGADIRKKLETAGFEVKLFGPETVVPEKQFRYYGIREKEDTILLCTSKA